MSNLPSPSIEVSLCTKPSNDKPWLHWRNLPDVHADVMIISSYGQAASVTVSEKLVHQESSTKDKMELAREELAYIQNNYKMDDKRHVVHCYIDHEEKQPKDYYLEIIRKFFIECKRQLG